MAFPILSKIVSRRSGVIIAACALALQGSATQALTIAGLKGQGLDHIYGSYAPRGDCSEEPRVTIDDKGMTFRAHGRTVTPPRVEYAVSFMGPSYEGITAVFMPFPISPSDSGRVYMYVNDDEKAGVIRFEDNLMRGQRPDPFHAAFTAGGLFMLCKGSAAVGTPASTTPRPAATPAAAVQGIPAEWTNLASLVGKYPGSYAKDNIDLLDRGAVATALKARLGPKMDVLRTNLSVVTPLKRVGNYYYLSGNAQHKGGEEQAYIMIDPARRAVQVGLWERGKLSVYAPATGTRLPVAPEIKTLLDNSPPETAVALPGTPWEVVPVAGRAPMAYVSAAASPNIEALSLYCEGGKPYMAMLLNKPATGNALTMTWNFAGRLVNIPVQRGSANGTHWIGGITGTPLVPLLTQQKGTAMLRINGRLEGEASLSNATMALRAALRGCVKM
ncbi:hypothetical protein M2336_000229 [Sphingobium sp. B1D7B]|uniref:hypothetical protein n=1 Tax=unclassified Sphingobium TaxID=2611147 RepID=UPI0022246365|nr:MULTISPECIES: hypothetical protein [unclassified Sphingobium]MCW2391845.1 hypothetical protein [Sphingobium sp. B11D3A]MCW2403600.1 hypothetical protein [Sphingobium sp. B1D7B]